MKEKMPRPVKKRGRAGEGDGVGGEPRKKKAATVVPSSPRVTRSASRKGGGGGPEENNRNLQSPAAG